MLTQLTIRDFAIIDRLTVEWEPGLNVLTGETGAGKSIIIDAVSALLGGRISSELVRTGARRAIVEGLFDLSGRDGDHELELSIDEFGAQPEDGCLILSREIAAAGGRSVARINGRAVPSTALQQIGERLIDIHGQSEHLSLLKPREHLELLDRFAGLTGERAQLAALTAELRSLERDEARIREEARRTAREQELLRHEVDQIRIANLREGEDDELRLARDRLRNVERLRSAAASAYEAIGGGDERAGAADLLEQAAAICSTAASIDPTLGPEAMTLKAAAAQAGESARALRRYLDQIEDDPRQLESIEERLLLIGDLERKFGDTVAAVMEYADHAEERLRDVERQDQLLESFQERRLKARAGIGLLASVVSARRAEYARQLEKAVEAELADLSMTGVRFVVTVRQEPDSSGLELLVDGVVRSVSFDSTGIDRVELLISTNPSEEPKSLGRIASGGELSRVSLALKTVLSRVDARATLIFDEVDVGVGGRTGPVVGEKLWGLTREHQVLCVTHMPQVAAYADAHVVVAKEAEEGMSRVGVRRLEPEERVAELAAMLGGRIAADSARQTARELMKHAERRKTDMKMSRRLLRATESP